MSPWIFSVLLLEYMHVQKTCDFLWQRFFFLNHTTFHEILIHIAYYIIWPQREKSCLRGFAKHQKHILSLFYLRRFSESRSSSGSTPSGRLSVRTSVRLSVRPKHCRVPSLCNLSLQKFLFFFIQTLPNDYSHIEDVHLLFCARFINFFLIFEG